jgi:hypothetical protein
MAVHNSDGTVTMQTTTKEAKSRVIRNLINEAENRIFYVFYKKLDNTMRQMICRRYTSKGIKGTSKYDVEEADIKNNQMTVYDMQSCGYRKINLDTVCRLTADGITYNFSITALHHKSAKFELLPQIKEFVKNIPDKSNTKTEVDTLLPENAVTTITTTTTITTITNTTTKI